jgi:PAS domain-containing protein
VERRSTNIDNGEYRRDEEALSADKEQVQIALASMGEPALSTDSPGSVTFRNPIENL